MKFQIGDRVKIVQPLVGAFPDYLREVLGKKATIEKVRNDFNWNEPSYDVRVDGDTLLVLEGSLLSPIPKEEVKHIPQLDKWFKYVQGARK